MSDSNRPNAGRGTRQRASLILQLGLVAACALWWAGCSPQKNYKLLSFFFDGVPDPNAPPAATGESNPVAAIGKSSEPIISTHKPFAQNQCSGCHKGGTGASFEFSAVNANVCLDCHEKVLHEYPLMHAPVASKACLWCHNPHESSLPSLLREPAPAICTQCHEKDLLGPKPPEHLLADSKCLDCHVGHGGTKRYQLRSDLPASGRPTSAPASGGGA